MKHHFFISLLVWVLFGSISLAQTFTGHVKDAETKKAVPFTTVYFVELETGTTSDGDGKFTIEHSPTRIIHIQISSVGYRTLSDVLDLSEIQTKEFMMEESHVDLEEVVISTPGGKLVGENVVNIDRKKLTDLQRSTTTSLAEALSGVPGVENTSTGSGIGKPVIRGLSGNRIVTYAQGIRIENQQWGEEHGLGVGDVGIESVEVIKGPASLLYGSDALGGVLYFVSERYAQHNTIEGFIRSNVQSNSLGNTNNMGVKMHKGRMKLNLFGTYSSHADYKQANNDRVFNTRFDEKNIKAAFGYDLKNWISHLRYSYLQNNFGIPEDTSISTTDRNRVMPYQAIDNQNLSWENTLFIGDSKVNLIGGYSGNRRKEFEDFPKDPTLDMELETYSYNAKWYSAKLKDRFDVITGVQGMIQKNRNSGRESLVPDGSTMDFGGFSIFNYTASKLHVQSGIRADQRKITTNYITNGMDTTAAFDGSFGSINYSVGLVYKGKKVTLRSNLSSGFRAPNTSELLSNGVHEGTNRFEIGNRNLKSERATQVDFTIDYRSEHLSIQVNPFYNVIDNYIYLLPADTVIDNAPVFEYKQTNASLFGGEAGIHYHPHSIHWLHIESAVSTVVAEDRSGLPLPMIPATKLNSTVKVEFSSEKSWRIKDIFFQHVYKFDQGRVALLETATPDYHLLNLGVAMNIGGKDHPVELTAGVKNMLNTQYIDHLSRLKPLGISNQGINFYFGLRLSFNKAILGPKED